MPERDQVCPKCHHCREVEPDVYECRLHAPPPLSPQHDIMWAAWPRVSRRDWCGEFTAK
jgi:hypothetical protein